MVNVSGFIDIECAGKDCGQGDESLRMYPDKGRSSIEARRLRTAAHPGWCRKGARWQFFSVARRRKQLSPGQDHRR